MSSTVGGWSAVYVIQEATNSISLSFHFTKTLIFRVSTYCVCFTRPIFFTSVTRSCHNQLHNTFLKFIEFQEIMKCLVECQFSKSQQNLWKIKLMWLLSTVSIKNSVKKERTSQEKTRKVNLWACLLTYSFLISKLCILYYDAWSSMSNSW